MTTSAAKRWQRLLLRKVVPPVILISVLIAIWWVWLAYHPSPIFPTPGDVVRGTAELVKDGTIWDHIGASLARVSLGFSLALVVAIPLGLWMGLYEVVDATLNPLFQIMRPISPIAWIPIAILLLGVSNASPIFIIFIATVFPMIVQTAAAVHTIEPRYLRAAANFGVSGPRVLVHVIIPAILPQVIVGMRISLGVSWLVVVAAEMIALRSGLGFLIIDSRNAGNRYDLVIAAMIIIGLIGLLLDGLMRLLERLKSVRWRYVK
ncbi:MAG: ABC transporter permease [Proteobacteria bacterium]|nr:ABC transporter permease [Pseudomonadota bacterium]